ncbi:MAG: hypothetical protein KIT09_00665 [Bryobacteraceae bacterium]|nr:hypothetical protein [Bryobacteraceae bacterium]
MKQPILLACLCLLSFRWLEGQISHAYFLDASGSMKGLIGAPGSAARDRIAKALEAVPNELNPGSIREVHIFNTTTSPAQPAGGSWSPSAVGQYVRERLPSSGNTDLLEVLETATRGAKANAENVTFAWVLTDNVNDPRGQGSDVQNTRRFYGRMFEEPSAIRRVYFFPLREARMVLYLLVLSEEPGMAKLDLDRLENALDAYGRAVSAPRIRAKPVGGEQPVEIDRRVEFEGAEEKVRAEVVGQGRRAVLRVAGLKEGEPLRGTFRIRLRSRFNEWRIEKATVKDTSLRGLTSDDFPNINDRMSARLTPSAVAIDPRATSAVRYALELGPAGDAPVPNAPFFTLAALNPDGAGLVRGQLALRIDEVKLALKIFNDPEATEAIQNVFQLRDIEYFVPRERQAEELRLDFTLPVEFEVEYTHWTRWLALAAVIGALAVAGFVLVGGGKRRVFVRLEGYSSQPVPLEAGKPLAIAPGGQALAKLELTRTGRLVCRPVDNATVNGGRKAAVIAPGGTIAIQFQGAEYRYRAELVKAAAAKPPRGSGMY